MWQEGHLITTDSCTTVQDDSTSWLVSTHLFLSFKTSELQTLLALDWHICYSQKTSTICFKLLNFWSLHSVFHLKKVKCTLVQALRLCTGRTAYRESRGIALPFHDHGTRRGWGVSVTPRPFFTPGKDPVPIVQEAEWAPGLVWTGAENLAPTGIRSPDRPARSQSLYRLRYPAHWEKLCNAIKLGR